MSFPQKGQITLYFLNASRSIRIAWLLEELNLEYEVVTADRVNGGAPESLKDKAGTKLGKFPVLRDGDMVLEESGAITEYIIQTYDRYYALRPMSVRPEEEVRKWIHAAEATFCMHALPILYLRWFGSEEMKKNGELDRMEQRMSVSVRKDLAWLDRVLKEGHSKYLVDDRLSGGDIMMGFSLEVIFARELGTKRGSWPIIEEYLERLKSREAYLRAVKRTGHSMAA